VMPSFLVFGGIIYVLFFSQYFQIKEVKIFGVKTISEEALRKKVNAELSKKVYFFIPQNNLFLFPAKKVKTDFLKEFPKTKNVFIKRGLLNFLEIKVEEREMAAIWCGLPNCFFIDKDGVIFEEAPSVDGSLIFKIDGKSRAEDIKLGDRIFEPDFMNKIFDSKKIFEDGLGVSFPSFTVLEDNVLEANSSFGWKIIFDSPSDLGVQMEALKKIFEEMKPEEKEVLEYFNLRIEGRIYYK